MDSIIQQKSREFAIRIIGCYKYLIEEQRELVMSKVSSGSMMNMDMVV